MRTESMEFLKDLLNTASPGGYESAIQKRWCDYVRPFADEIHTDAYGNAIAVVNPKGRPRVLLDGHCDEIALMVKHIDDRGFLYFQPVGGIDASQLRAKRVNIHTEKGIVRGVVGATPGWLLGRIQEGKDQKAPKVHECWIDIGARDGKDAQRRVAVGDPITFGDEFEMLNRNVAVARACDDRIGVWLAAEALRLAAAGKPRCAIYACSSVQEETGCHGAQMVVDRFPPDVALALEVTHATDSPGLDPTQFGKVVLGGGPTVSIGRENHPVVVKRLRKIARAKKIPLQVETFSLLGGTNARVFWVAKGGIPSAVIGVPDRYMHSTVEMVDLRDVEHTAALVAAFCLDLKSGEAFRVEV